MSQIQEFNDYRAKMNEVILGKQNKVINRLFNLDTNTYAEGALNTRTKEMLGLVASISLVRVFLSLIHISEPTRPY